MWLNYDEQYAVSEDGLVMNRKTGLILSPVLNIHGRLHLSIYYKKISVHKMVALRFCPKIDIPNLEIDHINRDKTDNRACNLRWCDRSTNNRNRGASNLCKDRNGYQVKFTARRKIIYCKTFKTMEEAVAARDAFKLTDAYKL